MLLLGFVFAIVHTYADDAFFWWSSGFLISIKYSYHIQADI